MWVSYQSFLLIIMMVIVIIIIITQRTFHEVALPVHCFQVVVLWCCGGRKIGILREKNPSEQQREPITNSTHMWRQVQESNPTHSSMRASTLTTAPYLFPHLIQFVRTVNSLKKPKGRGEGCSTPGLSDRDSL